MPLEIALSLQIERNAVLLGEGAGQPAPRVYHVLDTTTAQAEFLGMTEADFDELMAGVVCRNWDDCEIEGD